MNTIYFHQLDRETQRAHISTCSDEREPPRSHKGAYSEKKDEGEKKSVGEKLIVRAVIVLSSGIFRRGFASLLTVPVAGSVSETHHDTMAKHGASTRFCLLTCFTRWVIYANT